MINVAINPICAIAGVRNGALAEVPELWHQAIEAMREALPAFDKTLPGYFLPDALLTAVETRTSSPVRITRDAKMESINTQGLIPAGEGAGYAGGILSAGIDGIKAAEALARKIASSYSYD